MGAATAAMMIAAAMGGTSGGTSNGAATSAGQAGQSPTGPTSAYPPAIVPAVAKTPAQSRPTEGWTSFSHWKANSKGQVTKQIYLQPQFRISGGKYVPIDATIRPASSKTEPAAATGAIRPTYFGSKSDHLIRLQLDGGPVVISAPALVISSPHIEGNSVIYRDVAPDTDLRYQLDSGQLKEDLVLKGPRALRSATFHISDPSHQLGQAHLEKDGSYRFDTRIDGDVGIVVPAPRAYEQPLGSIPPAMYPGSASMTIQPAGDGFDTTVAVDAKWMVGKVYPIVLDPTYQYPSFNENVGSTLEGVAWPLNNQTNNGSAPINTSTSDLGVGTFMGQGYNIEPARSFYRFDVSSIPANSQVTAASLNQWTSACLGTDVQHYYCNANSYDVDLYQMNGYWDGNSTYGGLTALEYGSSFSSVHYNPFTVSPSGCSGGGCFPSTWAFPTTVVQGWVGGANNGFAAQLRNEAPQNQGGPSWAFRGTTSGSGAHPHLDVTYIPAPSAPSSPFASAGNAWSTVTWGGSSNNSGSAVASYTAKLYQSGGGLVYQVTCGSSCSQAQATGLSNGTWYYWQVVATNVDGLSGPLSQSNSISPAIDTYSSSAVGTYRTISVSRILNGTNLAGGGVLDVQVAGVAGIPSDKSAVAATMDLTAANPTGAGYLIVYPKGVNTPNTSAVNFNQGQTVSNLVQIPIGKDGQIEIYNPGAGSVTVIVDAQGYISTQRSGTTGLYDPVIPARVASNISVTPLSPVNVQVTGVGGIPASGVSAVVLNVTAANASAASYLTAYPYADPQPNTSNTQFAPGVNTSDRAIIPVKSTSYGYMRVVTGATISLYVDVIGYYTDGSNTTASGDVYHGLTPYRICDTRAGNLTQCTNQRLTPTNSYRTFAVRGQGGIPSSLPTSPPSAAVTNLTAVNSDTNSYITEYASGDSLTNTSDVNYNTGQNVPDLVIAKIGSDGKIVAHQWSGSVDILDDVAGYYSVDPAAAPQVVTAVAGDQQATVEWSTPAWTGGAPISTYTVTPWIGSTPQPNLAVTVAATVNAVTLNQNDNCGHPDCRLQNGTTYTFHVHANNSAGVAGLDGVSNSVTPSGFILDGLYSYAHSDGLGLEQFYPYEKSSLGTGTQYTNLFDGNNVVQYTDMSLPATGLNIGVKRTYNSQRRDQSDTLGRGWVLSTDDALSGLSGVESGISDVSLSDALAYLPAVPAVGTFPAKPGEFHFVDGDGTTHVFTEAFGSTTWTSPPGVSLTLRNEGSGFVLIRSHGAAYHITNVGSAVVPDYRLQKITDRAGNQLNYIYEANGLLGHRVVSISNPTGPQTVTFAYDTPNTSLTPGHLTGVSTNGRTTAYSVDSTPSTGPQLASVTIANGTADAQTTRFNYQSGDNPGGLLASVQDAVSVSKNAAYTTRFAYMSDSQYSDQSNPRRSELTLITDRSGSAWQFCYGATTAAQCTRSSAGAQQSTRYTDPNSHVTSFAMSPAANLLSTTDSGDNNGTNTTSFTWTQNADGTTGNRVQNMTVPRTSNVSNTTSYTYDPLGDIISVTRPAANSSGYDSQAITDNLSYCYSDISGATTGCSTDSSQPVADLTRVDTAATVGADTRTSTFAYYLADPSTGALSHTTIETPAATGNSTGLTSRVDQGSQVQGAVDNRVTAFAYFSLGRIKTITDARGNPTSYGDPNAADLGYHPSGNPKKITDAKGNATSFVFTAFGQSASITDRDGHVKSMQYTNRDQLWTSTNVFTDTTKNQMTTFGYDANGNQVTVQTPRLFTATNGYDRSDRLISVQDANGGIQSYQYDSAGLKVYSIPPSGNVAGANPADYWTKDSYFANNRLQTVLSPGPGPIASTPAETDYTYFKDGLAQAITLPGAAPGTPPAVREVHTAAWTPAGKLASESDQVGSSQDTTLYCYDGVGNQYYARQPKGGTDSPPCPAPTDTTQLPFVTRTTFDKLNQVAGAVTYVTRSGGSGLSTLSSGYSYDPAGNRLSAALPTGTGAQATTTYTYDPQLNDLAQETDPSNPGHTVTFSYTSGEMQQIRTDLYNGATFRTTTQRYNDNNALQETDVTDANSGTQLNTLYYNSSASPVDKQSGYDLDGNLLQTDTVRQDPSGSPQLISTSQMAYGDPRDLLTSYTQTATANLTGTGSAVSRVTSYLYYPSKNVKTRTYNGQPTNFTYWQSEALKTISDGAAGHNGGVTVNYEPDGREQSRTLSNSTTTNTVTGSRTYQQNGQLQSVSWTSPSATLLAFQGIQYDANNNKTSEQAQALQQSGATKSGATSYGYDELNRLTSYVSPWSDGTQSTSTAFGLDDAGNATTETNTGSRPNTVSSTYPGGTPNRIGSQTQSSPSSFTSQFQYDGVGQQSARQVGGVNSTTTTYDAAGHTALQSSFTNPADPTAPPANSVVAYAYGSERMVRRVENSTKTTLFFYPDPRSSAVAEETDQTGATQMLYVCDPAGTPIEQDDQISGETNGWSWYLRDSRGNIATRLSDTWAVLETKAFTPYGKDDTNGVSNDSTTISRLGFQGAWKDPKTAEYAIGSRTFDPSVGRFTSADSFASAGLDLSLGSDPLTGNRYLYAGANPAGWLDDGHRATTGQEDAPPPGPSVSQVGACAASIPQATLISASGRPLNAGESSRLARELGANAACAGGAGTEVLHDVQRAHESQPDLKGLLFMIFLGRSGSGVSWPRQGPGHDCEACAREIQAQIGGEVVKITPDQNLTEGAFRLGPSTNDPEGQWEYHYAVLKDGRYYDSFTGPEGMTADEYRANWGDTADLIRFGPEVEK